MSNKKNKVIDDELMEEIENVIENQNDNEDEVEINEQGKANEYLERLQRLQAEFENYRKRNALLAINAKEEGIIKVVEKMLPVLDSFKSANKQVTNKKDLEGLNFVKDQMLGALTSLGITKIEAENQMFDPNLHNVVMVSKEKSKESGIVLEELQEGYKLGDKVIRYSVVKISE